MDEVSGPSDIYAGEASRAKIPYGKSEVVLEVPSGTDHIGNFLLTTGTFYELGFLRTLKRILRPDSLVVDVGANIGNHTLFLSAVCLCRVVAYEPVASTAKILARNVELNFVDGLVEIRRTALGAEVGRAKVSRYSENNVGGTQLTLDPEGSIELRTLDSEWFEGPIAFIKIDAEGMDLDVLQGASHVIDRYRPIISYEAAEDENEEIIRSLMHRWGYACLGVFNATATFLYAPARDSAEVGQFLQHHAQISLLRQETLDEMQSALSRNVRYTQRLMKEHLDLKHAGE